jgi:hypothetical protein
MSQVLVWKSDADGKLFEDKTKYTAHLRKLGRSRQEARKIEQAELDRRSVLDRMGQVSSIDELNQFIKDNWEFFYYTGARHNDWKRGRSSVARNFHEYIDVRLSNLTIGNISNSHSCPVGGVTNWSPSWNEDKTVPTNYPGWRGRIDIRVRTPLKKYKGEVYSDDGYGSDYFNGTGIDTGSGGGGGTKDGVVSYSYDVRIWAAHFPVIWEKEIKQLWIAHENESRRRAWKAVGGKTVPLITEVPEGWVIPDPLITNQLLAARW